MAANTHTTELLFIPISFVYCACIDFACHQIVFRQNSSLLIMFRSYIVDGITITYMASIRTRKDPHDLPLDSSPFISCEFFFLRVTPHIHKMILIKTLCVKNTMPLILFTPTSFFSLVLHISLSGLSLFLYRGCSMLVSFSDY